MQENLATENAIPLEPNERRKPIKKAREAKYLHLTKGKGKSKFTCSRRTGAKATITQKTYMVNVPVTEPKISELPNPKITKKAICDCGNHETEIREEDNLLKCQKFVTLMILLRTQNLLTPIILLTSYPAPKLTWMNCKYSSSESTRGKDP